MLGFSDFSLSCSVVCDSLCIQVLYGLTSLDITTKGC